MVALVHRCLQCAVRILASSYLAYAPVPPRTWQDLHLVYAFARDRKIHQTPATGGDPDTTPERTYVQALLLALANPYGFRLGELNQVLRYLHEHSHWAKLTDVPPVHRMAKAVAIVPVGNDFPPFSANKGGTGDGAKLYLLTFDLAFQLQEQLRALDAGGPAAGIRPGRRGARAVPRDAQAAVAPVGDTAGAAVQPPAFARPGRDVRGDLRDVAIQPRHARGRHVPPAGLPAMSKCQVINHTPAGYALRQADTNPTALRIGELIALRSKDGRRAGGDGALVPQHAEGQRPRVRLRDRHRLARGRRSGSRGCADGGLAPVVVVPEDPVLGSGHDPSPPQLIVPSETFQLEQALTLKRPAPSRSWCSPSSPRRVRASRSTNTCRSRDLTGAASRPPSPHSALACPLPRRRRWFAQPSSGPSLCRGGGA